MTASDARGSVEAMGLLAKASAVLDVLADAGDLTPAEVADRVGEPRSSIYRLLASMARLELVEPAAERGSWRLGMRLFRLGSAVVARFDVRQVALPVMERVHEETGNTVFLLIRRYREAVCIERIEGRGAWAMAIRVGTSLPLHVGGGPKVLLAAEPPEMWEEYAAGGLPGLTERTITDPKELVKILRRVRREGVSVSNEDVVAGLAAVGSPVFDHRGDVCAALSMSGPAPALLRRNATASCTLIRTAASEISRAMGHVGAYPGESATPSRQGGSDA